MKDTERVYYKARATSVYINVRVCVCSLIDDFWWSEIAAYSTHFGCDTEFRSKVIDTLIGQNSIKKLEIQQHEIEFDE